MMSLTDNLKDNNRFSQAINVLLNYWEIKPTQYEARLQEFILKEIKTVCTFIPWAHIETDIFHSLKKFVKAAVTNKLNVRLMVMPELGMNYPNAGVPKDLLTNISNLAVDQTGKVIYSHSAPNIFPLPSFSSPEVLKRYGNFLIRIGSILGEVFSEVGSHSFCEVVISNTFFSYYRNHGICLEEHGDYSAAHVMAFRDFLDREYRTSPSVSAIDAEQFKTQLYEGYNRHRFFTHVEKLLREKTEMVFSRKKSLCSVRHIDLFNPECAPESKYQGLITELMGYKPSLQKVYESIIAGGYRGEAIFLSNAGSFRRFTDQEKNFLILASVIHSGEVELMADEFFKLSPTFHSKLRRMMRFLDERAYTRQSRVI
ncbi:MAG: hypothetical protein AB7F43_05175 [Bacteriovoracia bacterium]